MVFIKIYNCKPKLGEYVNFIFTEYKDDYLSCYLTEYDIDCIITFHCLTSKKKIKSMKSLAPLNKEMVGVIESIDGDNIELNIISVNKKSDDYNVFIERNKSLHFLKKCINQYSHKYNTPIESILKDNIYKMDIKSDDINNLGEFLDYYETNDFNNFVKEKLKSNENKKNEIKIKLTCYGDINDIIKIFDDTINELNISDINIIQPKSSEYIISSSNYNLNEFFTLLKNNISKYNDIVI